MKIEQDERIDYLCGSEVLDPMPAQPFDKEVLMFLGEWSDLIRKMPRTAVSEELRAFAFWMRPSNLLSMEVAYKPEHALGLGIAFHIAPANVPLMFAYTCVIGLLAGNSCRVRVSGRVGQETSLICSQIQSLLDQDRFEHMRHRISIVSYDQGYSDITEYFSKECDIRVVWGGDQTIETIRQIPMKASAEELVMPDRTSIAVLGAEAVAALSDEALAQLAAAFYNDTYAMDQNACSCPKIVFWQEEGSSIGQKASERFWNAVARASERYALSEIKVSRKYGSLFECAMLYPEIRQIKRWHNRLYVAATSEVPEKELQSAMQFGSFLEYHMKNQDEWTQAVSEKTQTLTCYGVDIRELRETVLRQRLKGVYRIVPVGQALWMDLNWDGKNLIRRMSRTVF